MFKTKHDHTIMYSFHVIFTYKSKTDLKADMHDIQEQKFKETFTPAISRGSGWGEYSRVWPS